MEKSKAAKRRVSLKGIDSQYAVRDALRAVNAAETIPELQPLVEKPKSTFASSKVEPSPKKVADTANPNPTLKKAEQKPVNSQVRVRLDYRIGLGDNLSAKLHALSAQYGIPAKGILKSARTRALKALKPILKAPEKPVIPVTKEGGVVVVVSTSTSGKCAENLVKNFDPLNLGLAPAAIRPIVVDLLQKELRAIIDAAP